MRPFRSRPLLLAGPSAVTGVLLSAAPWPWASAGALLLAAGAALLRRSGTAVLAFASLLAGLAAGSSALADAERSLAAMERPCARSPPPLATSILEVDSAGEDPFRRRAWLQGRGGDGVGVVCAWPGALPDGLARGARVRVAGRFRVPHPPGNPGEADGRRQLAARGVSLVANLRTGKNVEVLDRAPRGPSALLARARRAGARRLRALLPEDVAPLVAALVLGIRGGIAPEDRVLFERTGTMHVLAISGMHLLLLAGVLHRALRWAGAGPRTAAAATLLATILYVPVAGGAPPVRRAATVLAFHCLALARGRPPDLASALGGAALALCLVDPNDVFRVGFRLSFAAAAGIALLAPAWHRRWSARHRLLARFPAVRRDRPLRLLVAGYVLRALPVSLAAWCVTQPLVAQSFGIVTPLAPGTNMLVAPLLVALLPPAALLALGVDALAGPVTLVVRVLRHLLEVAALAPGACWLVTPPPVGAVLLLLAAAALLRRGVAASLPPLALGLLVAFAAAAPATSQLLLFDVGHGQACLVRFRDGDAVLVDGGSRSRREVGRRVLLPALRALGVRRLEAVVCTHADADHWNGLPDVLARVPVRRLVVGAGAPRELTRVAARFGAAVVRARRGAVVHGRGGDRLLVLAAGEAGLRSRNDRSLVLRLEMGGRSVLLPADREDPGLRALAATAPAPCDVLVAPHHGARCAFARELGAQVRPRWLLVSAAPGFADPSTLAAYGAGRVLRTSEDGCITVAFTPGAVAVRAFRTRATIRAP